MKGIDKFLHAYSTIASVFVGRFGGGAPSVGHGVLLYEMWRSTGGASGDRHSNVSIPAKKSSTVLV